MERILLGGSEAVFPDLETLHHLSNAQTHIPLKHASLQTGKAAPPSTRNLSHVTAPTIPVSDLAKALDAARDDEYGLLQTAKKKPGRKPSNVEPTNKRTAQNRAAQRAFRERRERYVRDLETRVAQLEAGTDAVALVKENLLLKQRIKELESKTELMKQNPFSGLEFPLLEKIAGQANGSMMFPIISSDETPKQSQQEDIPSFSDLLNMDLSSILRNNASSQPSLPVSQSQYNPPPTTPLDFNTLLDFTSPSFTQLRDVQTPYGFSFESFENTTPQQPEYLDFANSSVFNGFLNTPTSQVTETPIPEPNEIEGFCEDNVLRDRVIDFVEDESALEELCELFRTKARCSDVQDIQRKMVDACKRNDKEEFLDLVMTVKEKKRMYMLRLKAGLVNNDCGLECDGKLRK